MINYNKTIQWYDKNAQHYAEKSNKNTLIDRQQLLGFSSLIEPGGRILDAGCGSGRDSYLFYQNGFRVTGVDIAKNLLAIAKKTYPDVNFQVGNILRLSFKDNTFDGIWSHASIVHFDTDEQVHQALSELFRVLKPQGKMHLLVRAQKGDDKTAALIDTISGHERHYRNFSEAEINKMLKEVGFSINQISRYNESDIDPSKRPGEGIEWILVIAQK